MSTRKHRAGPVATTDAGPVNASGPTKDLSPTPSFYAGGLDQAIDNATTDWWTSGALLAIQQLASMSRGFTVDHVLELTGQPDDPHYIGAAFAAAQRMGVIEPVGCKVGAGGRLVRIWWGRAE